MPRTFSNRPIWSHWLQDAPDLQRKGSFTLAFLPRRKRWRFGHSFYVCRHGCIWQPRQANPCTLGRDVLKNRTFSIFQTASPQGFPLNLPCLNLYLWQKTCTSMAKTSDENAEQIRQCKRALKMQRERGCVSFWKEKSNKNKNNSTNSNVFGLRPQTKIPHINMYFIIFQTHNSFTVGVNHS